MDARRAHLWDLHDFATGRGLEIGPLHRPLVLRDEADVHYLDVRSREELLEHYAGDEVVMAGGIPEIDYPLIVDGRTRTLVEASQEGAPFDWVVASHVVEHVPDVVGWLDELAQVVVDDGTLVLVVPDRRYCFDVLRPPTTLGQLLSAHAAGDRRPSPAAVFDYFHRSVDTTTVDLWSGDVPGYDRVIHGGAEAVDMFERALRDEYVDCHVWLFTPDSLLRQFHDLRVLGRSQWYVDTVEQTPVNDLEFYVRLRRLPRGTDPAAEVDGEQVSTLDVPDWLDQQRRGREAEALERRLARAEQELSVARERLARKNVTISRLRKRLGRREAAQDDVQNSSFSLPRRLARAGRRRLG